jgi:enterochelin esterase-like enzyme
MGLTSSALFVVTVIVTVTSFVVATILTGRLGRGLLPTVGRGLLILLVAVMSIVSVAVRLNDDNGWYSSWSDLLGAPPETATQLHGSSARAAAAADPSSSRPGGHPSPSLPPLAQAGSRTQTLTVRGAVSGITNPVTVLLPPSYFSGSRTYPVIEAFHGIPGSPSGWTKTMGVGPILDAAVSARAIGESIVVIPELNSPAGHDGECVNGPPGTPQLETWLTTDVPSYVESHFRVRTDRSSWAAIGYSAGAWCAAMAGILHSDVYGASIVLSGYFSPQFASGAPWSAGGGGGDLARRYDLIARVTANPPSEAMWIQSGNASPDWPQTQAFLNAVRPPLSVTSVVVKDSGHRWDVWRAQVPETLRWLGANIPGFAAD